MITTSCFIDSLFISLADLRIGVLLRAGFLEMFQSGVDMYLAGDWPSARSALEAALKLKPDDGPALTLLRFMGSLQYKRPSDWNGFRELTEK